MQALSKAEGGNKHELSSLEEEADMPLEQLLAQYGYVVPNGTGASRAGASSGTASDSADTRIARQQRRRAAQEPGSAERATKRHRSSFNTLATDTQPDVAPDKNMELQKSPVHRPASVVTPGSSQHSGSESDPGSPSLRTLLDSSEWTDPETAAELHSSNGPAANRPIALGALSKSRVHDPEGLQSGSDFESGAEGSADEEDDEQTLEEEEQLAKAEGNHQTVS